MDPGLFPFTVHRLSSMWTMPKSIIPSDSRPPVTVSTSGFCTGPPLTRRRVASWKGFFRPCRTSLKPRCVPATSFLLTSSTGDYPHGWPSVTMNQKAPKPAKNPQKRYQQGLTAIRQVDMGRVIESFMQTAFRTVNRTFSDVQLNKPLLPGRSQTSRGSRSSAFRPLCFMGWGETLFSKRRISRNRRSPQPKHGADHTGARADKTRTQLHRPLGSDNIKRPSMRRQALITGKSSSKGHGPFTSLPKPWPGSWAEELG